ncbi:MAG: rhamnulokinase, partial [Clostridia bacterium]|nr:rhamnulokinase [Clostridia bacterium]
IGCELDEPVMTEKSNALELSNEMGANGKINFLKNISGLWLIQETRRDLAKTDRKYSYNELEMMARESEKFRSFIDPDAPELSAHGNLPDKIKAYCQSTGQPVPETIGQIVRCIYVSLALKYRLALEQISECTGKKFDVLHLMGGGTKDGFLCELASQSLGIPVIAGPVEATALGNIVLQLIALGEIETIAQGRKIIAETEKVKTFNEERTPDWDEAFGRFCEIIKK